MQHPDGHAQTLPKSDYLAMMTATDPAGPTTYIESEQFQDWQFFRDATDGSFFSGAQLAVQPTMPKVSNQQDLGTSIINYNNGPSNDSSLTLSPATPQLGHYQSAHGSYPYHLDCCYDFDLLYGSDLGLLSTTEHPPSECVGDRVQRKSVTALPATLNSQYFDSALSCCDSPPCTDPTCSDIVFCNEETACCYLKECVLGDPCDSEECSIDAVSSPPCYDVHCDEPLCTEAHTTVFCNSDSRQDRAGVESVCTCVDPACLSKDHPRPHIAGSDEGFARPAKRRRTLLDSEELITSNHGSHTRANPHTTSFGFPKNTRVNAEMDLLHTATPYSFNLAPATQYGPLHAPSDVTKSRHEQRSLAKDEPQRLVCRWKEHQSICGAVFASDEELQQHVELAHISGPAKQSEYLCYWEGCSKCKITDIADIVKIEQVDDVSPMIETSTAIMAHGNTANEEAPRRGFGTRPKLKRHVQVHTGYKPYQCEICGTQMKTRDALVKHQRTHTGEKPYLCPHCDKRFATTTELKTHSTVHTGEKPHVCPECGERFADSSNLSKHKKTHFSGMFKCEECGVQMKRWDQMKRHIEQRGHMRQLLDDADANKAYKSRMSSDFKPERVETRTEQKKRREGDRGRSFSILSEASTESYQRYMI